MAISDITSSASQQTQRLVDLRQQLDELQRQVSTGQKSETYAGLGIGRGLTLGLRSQLAALQSFDDTITTMNVRLSAAQTALTQVDNSAHLVKSAIATSAYVIDASGQTTDQRNAFNQLDQMVAALNTNVGDHYIFSGKTSDTQPVEATDMIVSGDANHAGLKQVIAERNQADLGTSGLGRLTIPAVVGSVVSVAEDTPPSVFGLKFSGVSSSLTGAVVTGPSGAPKSVSVDLSATNPNDGDSIQFTFNLPDGSTTTLALTATTATPPGAGQFAIGSTTAATATNLQAALTAGVDKIAHTSLVAASAVQASNEFFDTDATHPPLRVAGPPFDTATALVAGTAANTVTWYKGDAGSDPARNTAIARVDPAIVTNVGMRANEQALRTAMKNVAVFAAVSFLPTDTNASGAYDELKSRLATNLDDPQGTQKVSDIEADMAAAQTTLKAASDRHGQTNLTVTNMLQNIEGVSNETVASQLLAIQTSLQASLQTTAMLSKLSLVNYI